MQKYIGTKLLNAKPMTRIEYVTFRGWDLPADETGEDEGYLVECLDGGKPNVDGYAGYVSWSPKDVFEKAYRPVDAMSFGLALEAVKAGKKAKREGWAFKSNFICLSAKESIALRGKTASSDDWRPRQEDMLTDDWFIIE